LHPTASNPHKHAATSDIFTLEKLQAAIGIPPNGFTTTRSSLTRGLLDSCGARYRCDFVSSVDPVPKTVVRLKRGL
jgi:hypothetical protein